MRVCSVECLHVCVDACVVYVRACGRGRGPATGCMGCVGPLLWTLRAPEVPRAALPAPSARGPACLRPPSVRPLPCPAGAQGPAPRHPPHDPALLGGAGAAGRPGPLGARRAAAAACGQPAVHAGSQQRMCAQPGVCWVLETTGMFLPGVLNPCVHAWPPSTLDRAFAGGQQVCQGLPGGHPQVQVRAPGPLARTHAPVGCLGVPRPSACCAAWPGGCLGSSP